jgi:hypothetical protein
VVRCRTNDHKILGSNQCGSSSRAEWFGGDTYATEACCTGVEQL